MTEVQKAAVDEMVAYMLKTEGKRCCPEVHPLESAVFPVLPEHEGKGIVIIKSIPWRRQMHYAGIAFDAQGKAVYDYVSSIIDLVSNLRG